MSAVKTAPASRAKTNSNRFAINVETTARRITQVLETLVLSSGKKLTPVHLNIIVDPRTGKVKVSRANAEDTRDALDIALEKARSRGSNRITEILQSPDMLNARDFAPYAGVSHETVNQKRRAGQILGLEGPKRGFRFPKWQLDENGNVLHGIAELLQRLSGGPWAVYRFLLQEHGSLGGKTGLDALREGRVQETLETADAISHGSFT
jgi:hypothetical protein